ncbi:sarcosine oxidase subunit gamma [Pseudomonas sp. 5P_3.1_Bac2]|uniref:sarcosine oxidase subunit gamma n=1 Tax=Pseudomonas sp. 5P_3.1_Bac2 TaxID=2971617 RepID=UPI0021C655AB|nr:sarcosine oxidase subunit gamma family protein [Pseudomonas sp. 5P_3.1_Bac2]MCU1717810.1 sarcosine oxidase subunit gamma family protein [Pseudomonas sp. 5P_3.1_Bac2]
MSNLINVFPQRPAAGRAESPLYHADLASLAGKGPANPGVTLCELSLLGHLVLRGDAGDSQFVSAVEQVLGLRLPQPLQLVSAGERSAQWLAPDEWLLIVAGGTEFELEQELRAALSGQHVSLVNVSGGQTLLELRGPKVPELLMKSTSYDVHPDNFPVGKAVGSHFAKSQLFIRHSAEDTWQLVVRRSFADYIWLWLQDASAEYGLAIAAH